MRENENWRIGSSEKVYELWSEPYISIFIELRRLQRTGHVIRVNGNRNPESMNGQQKGRKDKDKWIDPLHNGSRNKRKMETIDTDEWPKEMNESRAKGGLQCRCSSASNIKNKWQHILVSSPKGIGNCMRCDSAHLFAS